jgi:hypothetical protein
MAHLGAGKKHCKQCFYGLVLFWNRRHSAVET